LCRRRRLVFRSVQSYPIGIIPFMHTNSGRGRRCCGRLRGNDTCIKQDLRDLYIFTELITVLCNINAAWLWREDIAKYYVLIGNLTAFRYHARVSGFGRPNSRNGVRFVSNTDEHIAPRGYYDCYYFYYY
jgi:hypothetical protein